MLGRRKLECIALWPTRGLRFKSAKVISNKEIILSFTALYTIRWARKTMAARGELAAVNFAGPECGLRRIQLSVRDGRNYDGLANIHVERFFFLFFDVCVVHSRGPFFFRTSVCAGQRETSRDPTNRQDRCAVAVFAQSQCNVTVVVVTDTEK